MVILPGCLAFRPQLSDQSAAVSAVTDEEEEEEEQHPHYGEHFTGGKKKKTRHGFVSVCGFNGPARLGSVPTLATLVTSPPAAKRFAARGGVPQLDFLVST